MKLLLLTAALTAISTVPHLWHWWPDTRRGAKFSNSQDFQNCFSANRAVENGLHLISESQWPYLDSNPFWKGVWKMQFLAFRTLLMETGRNGVWANLFKYLLQAKYRIVFVIWFQNSRKKEEINMYQSLTIGYIWILWLLRQ